MGPERSTTSIRGFELEEFDFQLMRVLGLAAYGGGAPGEIFYARSHITAEHPGQWSPAFSSLAADIDELGAVAAQEGFTISARDHFLRASMYWRCAEYFAHPGSQVSRDYGVASRASFLNAARHMSEHVEPISYEFDRLELAGYVMRPAGANAADRPTVILIPGFDSTSEELYFISGRAALERGFNVVIADGPGQTGSLRQYPDTTLRPDYEVPIAAVIDAILNLPDIDPNRLGLYGVSLGGYFVLRAAAHDNRIRAVVANPPIINVHRYYRTLLSLDPDSDDMQLAELDELPEQVLPPHRKQIFVNAWMRYGATGLHDWINRLQHYTVEDKLPQLRCPILAMVGTGESDEIRSQAEVFRERVSCPAVLYEFDSLGADSHCQLGALQQSNAVAFDWLSQQLA